MTFKVIFISIFAIYGILFGSADIKYGSDLEAREQIATLSLTPLMQAVLDNNISRVKLLIGQATVRKMLGGSASDLRINAQDSTGNTALMWAVLNKSPEIVKLLLEAPEIDLNIKDKSGLTALELAVNTGDPEILQMLMVKCDKAAGVCPDINKRDPRGYTPLMRAAQGGNENIIRLLLERGANPLIGRVEGNKETKPIDLARSRGHDEIVPQLEQAKQLYTQRAYDFIAALKDNNSQGAKKIFLQGINVEAEDPVDNSTPLYWAAERGDKDLVKMVLDAGANPNQELNKKQSAKEYTPIFGIPLLVATKRGDKEIVEMLIKAGADVNSKDSFRDTPLTLAIINGRPEIVGVLIDAGANLHQFGSDYIPPLSLAQRHGNKKIITMLKTAGAETVPGLSDLPPLH